MTTNRTQGDSRLQREIARRRPDLMAGSDPHDCAKKSLESTRVGSICGTGGLGLSVLEAQIDTEPDSRLP